MMSETKAPVPNELLMPWERPMDAKPAGPSALDQLASLLDPEEPKGQTTEESEPVSEGDSDEAASAPADAEVTAEESGEAEPVEEDEAETPAKYRTKVDGQEVEVTLEEALAGYSRTQDYTRKTQALAEDRRAFQSEAESVRADREKYREGLERLSAFFEANATAEPDWDTLYEQNPAEFAVQRARWDQTQQKRAVVEAERQRLASEEAARQEQAMQQHLAREQEALVSAIPEWKDEKVAKQGRQQVREYMHGLGFTDEHLAGVTDHRVVKMMFQAMQFEKLQKKGHELREKTQPGKAPLKPGTVSPTPTSSKAQVKRLSQARERLARSGSVEDAAAVFDLMGI